MSWNEGCAAVAVLSFDVDAESAILSHSRRHANNAMVMTHQAFGPRVGVPRILALLADYDLPATFFVPGLTADRYPETVAAILEAGHEVGHHSYSHISHTTLTPEEQRADFERALASLDARGVRPEGHRAAMWDATWLTPQLVAEYGLAYDSSLMDADTPYMLDTGAGTIAELPVHWSLDDWEQYAFLPDPMIGAVIESPAKVYEMWTAEIDAMRRHRSLFLLTCHPFLSGRASRIENLRRVVEFALGRGDVAFRSARQVAELAAADPALPTRALEPVEVDPEIYPE
jgi:peptidoglycan/xylan/chitin deacetylase (PgdA/CDA1 family)